MQQIYQPQALQTSEKENLLNRRMARWARMGWWEADFTDETITCSESLSYEIGILEQGCVMSFAQFAERVHPDQRQLVLREFEVLRDRDSYDVFYSLLTTNGYQWGHSRCALREVHPDGRIIVFGTWQKVDAPDTDELKHAQQRIDALLHHQFTLSNSLSRFIQSNDINSALRGVLDDILQYFKAGRVFIIEYIPESNIIGQTYETTAPGINPYTSGEAIYKDLCPYWKEALLAGNCVTVDSLDTLPAEGEELKERLAAMHVKSHLAVPIQRAGGRVVGFLGVDVTETTRHWAGEDIQWLITLGGILYLFRETENSRNAAVRERNVLESLFQNIPLGMEIYDKEGRLTEVNNKCVEIFDAPDKEALLGLNLMDEPNLTAELKERIRTEDTVDLHIDYNLRKARSYYRHQKEGVKNLLIKYCHLHDSKGEFCGYIVIYVDLTEQQHNQLRLKEFNQLFALIASYAQVGYAKLNLLTGERYAIDQWYKNLGIKEKMKEHFTLDEAYSHLHADDRNAVLRFVEAARRKEQTHFCKVLRVKSQDAAHAWNYLQCNILVSRYEPENSIIELISINYNITEMKELEMELKEAKERAETSERLKSAFLANMSHEIRTPLNAIVGFSTLLASEDCPTDMREECLNLVNKNNELLQQLISDVLDLAKIEAGTLEYNFKEISANDLCNGVAFSLRSKTNPGVELLFEPTEPDGLFTSDYVRLSQVLNNFVNNAIKFTSEGFIRIGWHPTDDQQLYFYVQDTGIGIEPDKQESVFDRFVKLNSQMQGTGLGLRICKEIVTHLGGTIGVQSRPGEGACFWFKIPLQPERESNYHTIQP